MLYYNITENAAQDDFSKKEFTHILLMGASASGKTYVSQNKILSETLKPYDENELVIPIPNKRHYF